MLKNKGGILYLVGLTTSIVIDIMLYIKYSEHPVIDEQVNDVKEVSSFDPEKEKELKAQADIFFTAISQVPKEDIPSNKIALGKRLYFHTRLSLDGTISCNSCQDRK